MNRKNNISCLWIVLCLALASLAGCSKQNISPSDGLDPSSGNPIAFEAEDAFTKAAVSDKTDIQNDPNGFRVWSWFQGTTAGPMFGTEGTPVTYDANTSAWTYSPTRYWMNGIYDFAAIYPAAITTGEGETAVTTPINGTYAPASTGAVPTLTVPDFDVTSQTDLLVAFNNGTDGTGINGATPPEAVNLSFQHALSNIQLILTLNEDDFFVDGTDQDGNPTKRQVGYAFVSILGFNNITTTGSMTATKSEDVSINWASSAISNSIRLNYTSNPRQVTLEEQYFLGDDGMLLIPQELAQGTGELYMQVIIYPLGVAGESITKEFFVPLTTGVSEWKPNTKYIYTGVITQELVIDFNVTTVNAWEDEPLGDFIVS